MVEFLRLDNETPLNTVVSFIDFIFYPAFEP